MLNADMISRSPTFAIHVVGAETCPLLRPAVERANEGVGLALHFDHPEWITESDHYVFYRMRIPILYFGVEDHIDYHQPTDTRERINADLAQAVSRLIFNTVVELSHGPRPAWNPQ